LLGSSFRHARLAARALTLLLALVAAPSLCGAREYLQVFVTAPYLELHTGPGRGFPVAQVVARDESVDIIKRQTDWFKVRTPRGVEGWASYKDMLSVVLADGTAFTFPMGDRAGFTSHKGEIGIFTGDYSGATLISAYGSYSFNSQLAI
jgi:SH3-like domain-containing protein